MKIEFEHYDQRISESKRYIWYVSSKGYIFRLCKNTGKRKRLSKYKKGENYVITKAGGKEYHLNQLVAKVFIHKWFEGCFVLSMDNHIFNNNVENLEVISPKEFINRLKSTSRSMPVLITNRIKQKTNRYRSIREAAKTLHVSYQTLADYLNDKTVNGVLAEMDYLEIRLA